LFGTPVLALGRAELDFRLLEARRLGCGVHADQDLALAHRATRLHVHAFDEPTRGGLQDGVTVALDLAGQRDLEVRFRLAELGGFDPYGFGSRRLGPGFCLLGRSVGTVARGSAEEQKVETPLHQTLQMLNRG
jgi:hypothetical protein